MRRLSWFLAASLAVLMAMPPALAVDLSDTTWDLNGRSRTWARSVGRAFGPVTDQITFVGGGTFSLATLGLAGTWVDEGGRRFSGEIDDADFQRALQDFINRTAGVSDATVTGVRVDRMWGHVSEGLDRMKMKMRIKVWFSSATLGVEQRGAWIKVRLRGSLASGTPVVAPD